MTDDQNDLFGPVIYAYTRAQAIEDGVLVDVSKDAAEAGIKLPCVVTRAVWAKYVEVPAGVIGQDERGRLWDIVWMTRHAMGRARRGESQITVELHVRNDNRAPRRVLLKAICGPGDDAAPVITIMLEDED